MLKDQLTAIEQLVDVSLRRQPESYEELQSLILNDLQSEVLRIQDDLKQAVNNTDNLERLQRYLQDQQHQLILLMDPVAARLRPEQRRDVEQTGESLQWFDSYRHVYLCLEELVMFMERRYSRYLNISYNIRVSSLISAADSLNDRLAFIQDSLGKAGISPEYINIIVRPLHKLVTLGTQGKTIAYQQLVFLHELKEGLTKLLSDNDKEITIRLLELFVYINFNDIDCYRQIISLIQDELDEIPLTGEKLNRLRWLQSKVNQSPENSAFSYAAGSFSLKHQVQNWLKEEIACIGSFTQAAGNTDVPSDLLPWLNFKLRFRLSVYELGYLVELLVKRKLIKNTKTDATRFFGYFCSTTQQDNLAANSLWKKTYDPSPSVIKSVRSILLDLANDARDCKRISGN